LFLFLLLLYGIAWGGTVDLAESELWLHGVPEQPASAGSLC
jgi:hypothetical protein